MSRSLPLELRWGWLAVVAAVVLFYGWWMLLYVVPLIAFAGNVPRLMSGEDARLVVEAMLAFALVDGVIVAVGIFMATGGMFGRPRPLRESRAES